MAFHTIDYHVECPACAGAFPVIITLAMMLHGDTITMNCPHCGKRLEISTVVYAVAEEGED